MHRTAGTALTARRGPEVKVYSLGRLLILCRGSQAALHTVPEMGEACP